jgi:flagella basal body P-ring formation protein FlgA
VDVQIEALRTINVAGDPTGAKAEVQWAADRVQLGRQNATILLTAGDGKALGRLNVALDAGLFRTVPVAGRDLPAGKVLGPEDVAMAKVRLTDLGPELPVNAAKLAGLVASRSVKAGTPLDVRLLGRQLVVRRGQPVTMMSQAGAVQITETVIAGSDGAVGDRVLVERPGARRQRLMGTVAAAGLVKVD